MQNRSKSYAELPENLFVNKNKKRKYQQFSENENKVENEIEPTKKRKKYEEIPDSVTDKKAFIRGCHAGYHAGMIGQVTNKLKLQSASYIAGYQQALKRALDKTSIAQQEFNAGKKMGSGHHAMVIREKIKKRTRAELSASGKSENFINGYFEGYDTYIPKSKPINFSQHTTTVSNIGFFSYQFDVEDKQLDEAAHLLLQLSKGIK